MKALSPDGGEKGHATHDDLALCSLPYASHMTLVSKPRIRAFLSKYNR